MITTTTADPISSLSRKNTENMVDCYYFISIIKLKTAATKADLISSLSRKKEMTKSRSSSSRTGVSTRA